MVPICSSNLLQHSFVLPCNSIVRLEVKRGNPNLTVDSKIVSQLKPGDHVEVTTDENPLSIVHDIKNLEPSMHWMRALRSKCRFQAVPEQF